MTVHVTIPIEESAKADLDKWARARGVTLDRVLADALEDYVRENRDIAEGVARGRRALAAGEVVEHDDAVAEFASIRAAWLKQD